MGNRQQYIHNTARTLMGKLGIKPHSMHYDAGVAQTLYKEYGDAVLRSILLWSNETLGRLACCGTGWDKNPQGNAREGALTTLYDVSPGETEIGKLSGDVVVAELALRAIIAAMADLCLAIWRKEVA